MAVGNVTQRAVDQLEGDADRDVFLWDEALSGFGVRVFKSTGRKAYVAHWKRDGRTRQITLGSHPTLKAEAARRKALTALAAVAAGQDPAAERDAAKASPTIADVCAAWLKLGTGPAGKAKQASTLSMDRSRIEGHVKPTIGKIRVRDLTAADVRRMVIAIENGETSLDAKGAKARSRRIVKGGPGVAHRTLRMVKAILAHAVREKLIATNPAANVHGGAENERERFLDAKEAVRLARALAAAERVPGIPWQAVAAIRLILASGLRRDEALALRWDAVDFKARRVVLSETKTGRSVRPLSKAAVAVLQRVKVLKLSGPFVFPASRGEGRFVGLQKPWARIRKAALLPDVHIHDLRHSFGAALAMSGAGLLATGRILGHAKARSTERYAHFTGDHLAEVADAAAEKVFK